MRFNDMPTAWLCSVMLCTQSSVASTGPRPQQDLNIATDADTPQRAVETSNRGKACDDVQIAAEKKTSRPEQDVLRNFALQTHVPRACVVL